MDGGGASSHSAGRDAEISAEARNRIAQEIELRLHGGGPRRADRRTLRDQQENRRALAGRQRLGREGERRRGRVAPTVFRPPFRGDLPLRPRACRLGLAARDVLLVFSVGGGSVQKNVSANLVAALQYARQLGASILGIVGRDGGYTATVADACVIVPTVNPQHITPHAEAFQAAFQSRIHHVDGGRTREGLNHGFFTFPCPC